MSQLLFPAPPPSSSPPCRGRSEGIPIRRIFCVGRNYEAHAKEMGVAVDREAPFYFTKAAEHYVAVGIDGAVSARHEQLSLRDGARRGDRRRRHSACRRTGALDCVFGYACGLDMTRRDLQFAAREQRRPWDLGKDVEQSAVLAEIVPAADIGHPRTGRIELRVNGETKQSSDLSLLIHDVPEVIAHLSTFYHLQPGDLIYTGTPEGVGPVKPGDALEGSIEGVGTIALTIGPPSSDVRARGSDAKGCVPWPAEFARRYVEAGLWEGITVAEMVERTARRQPQKDGGGPRRRRGSPMTS